MIQVPDFGEADLATLRGAPRHRAAEWMLTGHVGPLSRLPVGRYDLPTAGLAYLVFLAYAFGRARGVLGGRPGWEARETLASRVRSAAMRATGLASFAEEVFGPRGIGPRLSSIRGADWLWWREYSAAYADRWPVLRASLTDAIAGAGLLIDWLYDTDVRTALDVREEIDDAT